jgi:phthalate 4,5-cis-dihydrodiol dehydrogenase
MALKKSEKLRLGLVGLGAAGRAFLPAILGHDRFELAAVAEPDKQSHAEIREQLGAASFDSLRSMLAGCALDAVYIGTPTELHRDHVALVCAAGKHVLTEKPMSTSLDGAKAMVACAQQAGVHLLVGHSHSFDLPIRTMHEIIASGELGRVRMINTWCFTDWVYRPRRPDELNPELGGGVTYRQGAHQFDVIRLLGGGMLKSVRATIFDWDPNRKSMGAHMAYLQFEDGATATAVYNGYGHLPGAELCFDIGEWGLRQGEKERVPIAKMSAAPADELAAKRKRAKTAIPAVAPFQPFFGLTIVSCERGDLRQSPDGIYVYTHEGRREIALPADCNPRSLVLDEFADAIQGKAPPLHDGRWGLANLEVCAAAISSSQSGQEIELRHQVPVASRGLGDSATTIRRAAENV